MRELVVALLTWVSAYTGYPEAQITPEVVWAQPCEIQDMAFRDPPPCDPDDDETLNVMAIYDHDHARIYLREGWSATSLYDVSIMVHELVHHLQTEAGEDMVPANDDCSGQRLEKPAYQAQIAWLMATGMSVDEALKTMMINRLHLMMITSCQPPH